MSLGSSHRAELWEEMMSILNYLPSTYCVCPELGTQWDFAVTDITLTNK